MSNFTEALKSLIKGLARLLIVIGSFAVGLYTAKLGSPLLAAGAPTEKLTILEIKDVYPVAVLSLPLFS